MAIIIEPNIKVENIEIQMDTNSTDAANNIMSEWGRNIPIIKIGDYILNVGDLKEFSLQIALNSFPTFTIVLDDLLYNIRKALKNDIDKCIIFIGYKNWYLRFNGILDNSKSGVGDNIVRLNGTYYNEKFFNGAQFSYKDKKIVDIMKDICTKTNMGLFTYDNLDLNKQLDYSLMTGTRFIDYFDSLIKNYTSNIYSIDCHSYIHVGDIETLRKQDYDKYSLDWGTGEKLQVEQPIIFKAINNSVEDINKPLAPDFKIPIKYYGINTNFSEIFKETYNTYAIGYGGNGEQEIKSKSNIGIGSNKTNTFFGFKDHKFPYYTDKVNKSIGGNTIKITTNNVIFELNPFSVVGVELYLNQDGKSFVLDQEHSGKKIVLSFSIDYKKISKTLNQLSQTIELI
jgi:hypothetical protein